MKGKLKGKTYLLVSLTFAIVAGLLFSYGYVQATRTVSIVEASVPIDMDTPISRPQLKTVDAPAGYARQIGAVTDMSVLDGHFLSVSVVPNQPITTFMISTAQDVQSLLNQYVRNHKQEGILMELPATTTLANLVKPGQDIAIQTSEGNQTAPLSNRENLLGPIRVLGIDTPPKDSSSKSTLLIFVRNNIWKDVASAISSNQARVIMYPNGVMPSIGGLTPASSQNSVSDVKK